LGERGVGKSRLVKDIAGQKKKGENAINVVYANCASFDDDNKAESELFGYVKGAFTGANKDKKGLFCEADEGILFLDEVHHLSKLVQAKLMTALQTDNEGKFKIRSLGSPRHTDIKCLVIFASNKTIEELRNPETGLLPDFYDRISQFIIEIPPLRETQADREDDWKNSWKHLFKHEFTHNDQKLIDWLKSELLPGNFRDLEKIALAYKAFLDFNEDIKKELSEKTAHEYARAQYKKYHGAHTPSQLPHYPIDLSKPPKVLQSEFEKMLTELIIKKYGSAEKAEKELKTLFNESDVPTAKTLRNWLGKAPDS
jgi:transcriptional regulator with AAA-type ATPase domain